MNIQAKWWVLIGVSLASLIAMIDFTIVSTVLPAIQHELATSMLELQWVMNIFVLIVSMLMVGMGRLGDVFGQRKMLLFGISLFGIASLFAGLSVNPLELIISRGLQGIATAIIIPCSITTITHTFPTKQIGRAMGIWSSITGIGLAIGPVLGGMIVSILSWRFVFYINIPVVIISMLICGFYIEKLIIDKTIKVDWLGLLVMNIAIACLIIPVIQANDWGWGSPLTISMFVIAVLSTIGFIMIEKRVSSPIIDFNALGNRHFIAASFANFALVGFIWVAFFLIPLYLQTIRAESVFMIGLMLLTISGSVVIISPVAGYLTDRIGAKLPIIAGLVLLLFSAFMQAFFDLATPLWFAISSFSFLGIGWGMIQGPATSIAMSSVSKQTAGVASGALWTIQNIGGALSLAIAGVFFHYHENHYLTTHLQQDNINITHPQQTFIYSLLADPNRSQALGHEFTHKLLNLILSLFHGSFISGYTAAMGFVTVMMVLALIIVMSLLGLKHGAPTTDKKTAVV